MNLLINIDVDDLNKGIDFYTKAFDIRLGRHFGDWAELVGGSAPIYLLPKAAGTPIASTTSQQRTYERHWSPVHMDIVVDDIEAAIQRAVQAGAKVERATTMHKYGKLALLADPFGHGFCFIQFLGQGYDELVK
jgi:predicted enzyme related to lactoylglutathione lyase